MRHGRRDVMNAHGSQAVWEHRRGLIDVFLHRGNRLIMGRCFGLIMQIADSIGGGRTAAQTGPFPTIHGAQGCYPGLWMAGRVSDTISLVDLRRLLGSNVPSLLDLVVCLASISTKQIATEGPRNAWGLSSFDKRSVILATSLIVS